MTATARKIATLFYNTLRHGIDYADPGASYYEDRYRARVLANLGRRAKSLGYMLHEMPPSEYFSGSLPARLEEIGREKGVDPADRSLVRRRGAHRSEEQDHPTLGQVRLAPSAPRPANRFGLYFRRGLPERRQGRRPRHAALRHRVGASRSQDCRRRNKGPPSLARRSSMRRSLHRGCRRRWARPNRRWFRRSRRPPILLGFVWICLGGIRALVESGASREPLGPTRITIWLRQMGGHQVPPGLLHRH